MLTNYIKIAVRNILKYKIFSAINILGMAISLASFFLITIYILDEYQYDQHIQDANNKYRLYIEIFKKGSLEREQAGVPPVLVTSLTDNYPQVEYVTRIMNFSRDMLIKYQARSLYESNGVYAENSIFKMFSIPILHGDHNDPLLGSDKIAISESLAVKYFKNENAIGKTLNVDGDDLIVSAVFQDFPQNSQHNFNFILSFDYYKDRLGSSISPFTWKWLLTYVKLQDGSSPEELSNHLYSYIQAKFWKEKPEDHFVPKLMPIKDVHLSAYAHTFDIAKKGNLRTVYVLSVTAIFILVISCLNFINLSTARAFDRVKEVGLRKVIGAKKEQLVFQFTAESITLTFIALFLGGITTELFIPHLAHFTGKNLSSGILFNIHYLTYILIFGAFLGIVTGIYPALQISAYKPILSASSGAYNPKGGKIFLRKILVTIQFVLTFFLISGAIVISKQNTFIQQKDLGFDSENLIAINNISSRVNSNVLKQQFLKSPSIKKATLSYGLPGEHFQYDIIRNPEDGTDYSTTLFFGDHNFVNTLEGEIIAGRDFDESISSDSSAFIINEKALEFWNISNPKEAIGKRIEWVQMHNGKRMTGEVIGVLKNMHLESLRESIAPMVVLIYGRASHTITVRANPERVQEAISHMEDVWKKHYPSHPFTYRFIDENFSSMYKAEAQLNTLFKYFTGLTIIVASLGLLGLVIYSLTLKMKEVGIRKVLGASVPSLVVHLSKGFIKLLLLAFILAIPLSWYAAEQWLQNFQFRIEITPIIFLYAVFIILGLTLVTVVFQGVKTALLNPVDVIKHE